MKRMHATGLDKAVIGVSGGLDSTQALIVTARAMDRLDLPRANVLAYTMPGFATSGATHENALQLMRALRVTSEEVDIRPACRQMFADLGHPFARGEACYDVTFENVQAGARTSFLFRAANMHKAMVIGTSDLSELALGYTTYGVGDHMAHYHVNASVPKTLIQYLIRWAAKTDQFGPEVSRLLEAIVATQISPELVPPRGGAGQLAEEEIGPYELQDFNLYYLSRFGFLPSRVAYLAYNAWSDRDRGEWPDLLAAWRSATNTTSPPSANGSKCSCSGSLPRASSSARRCPTRQRWAQAARCRRAAIGGRLATPRPMSGSKS